MQRDELTEFLKENIVTVTFTKVSDGSTRKMNCTLLEDFLPPLVGSGNSKKNPDVIPVWSIEDEGWRSFRIDSIIDIEVI